MSFGKTCFCNDLMIYCFYTCKGEYYVRSRTKKSDRRVLKTKRAIRNAFIKLLAEKDINDITVTNIADEADIDRKTLYNYYGGIFEIREELENELASLLDQAIKEIDFANNIKNPLHIFEILTSILTEHLELCGYLMKLNANSHIVRKIDGVLRNKVRQSMEEAKLFSDSYTLDLCADFLTAGILSVYQSWFNSERRQPLEKISKDVGRLVAYGLKDFVKAD